MAVIDASKYLEKTRPIVPSNLAAAVQQITDAKEKEAAVYRGQTAATTPMEMIPLSHTTAKGTHVTVQVSEVNARQEIQAYLAEISRITPEMSGEMSNKNSSIFFQRYIWTLQGSMALGDWRLRSRTYVRITGLGPFSGIWFITSSDKTWTPNGFRVNFSAQFDPGFSPQHVSETKEQKTGLSLQKIAANKAGEIATTVVSE